MWEVGRHRDLLIKHCKATRWRFANIKFLVATFGIHRQTWEASDDIRNDWKGNLGVLLKLKPQWLLTANPIDSKEIQSQGIINLSITLRTFVNKSLRHRWLRNFVKQFINILQTTSVANYSVVHEFIAFSHYTWYQHMVSTSRRLSSSLFSRTNRNSLLSWSQPPLVLLLVARLKYIYDDWR